MNTLRVFVMVMLVCLVCGMSQTAEAGIVFPNGPLDGHRVQRAKEVLGNAARGTGRVLRGTGSRLGFRGC